MAKRFKLQFSRVIPSFQFCRPKHPSTFPHCPVPATYRLSPVNPKAFDITYPNFPDPPPTTPIYYPPIKCSPKIVSLDCNDSPCYTWKKKDVNDQKARRKAYWASGNRVYSDDDNDVPLPPKTKSKKKLKKQKSKNKKAYKPSGRTSSDSGWFSSEANEETETLVSSVSFSDDSSYDYDFQLREKSDDNRKKKYNGNKSRKMKRYVSNNWRGSATGKVSPEIQSPAKGTVFSRMMTCTVEGRKSMDSFAVEKKSEDPYEDFKRSMLEMILEKQMFEAGDLEELLHCFLSLNSRHHHEVIVQAFSEIWEVLFCKSPVNQRVSIMGL